MNIKLWHHALLIFFIANTLVLAQKIYPTSNNDIAFLTFGSCYGLFGHEPADIFYRIAELRSDLFIWLGDVAYVDEKHFTPPFFRYAGKEKIQEKFNINKFKPEYTKLRETTPMIGVWDDHDYGVNNGDGTLKEKDIVQQLWLDFLDEPADSIRRKRPGLYESYYVISEKHIKIILLDVRYFKDKTKGDMLGDVQWKWLEEQLLNNKAQYTFIGVGTSLFPDDRIIPEMWLDPSRDRLFDLIRKTKSSGVVFLSGDVHFAEIMKYPCKSRFGFDLYELTSSGLTHSLTSDFPLIGNRYPMNLIPETFSTKKDRYVDRNFGVLNITFGEKGKVEYQVRDYDGHYIMGIEIPYQDIKFDEKSLDLNKSCILDTPHYIRTWNKYKKEFLEFNPFIYTCLGVILLVFYGFLLAIWKCLSGIVRLVFPKKSKVKSA